MFLSLIFSTFVIQQSAVGYEFKLNFGFFNRGFQLRFFNTDSMEKKYSDEAVFCVKYLHDRGYLSEDKLDELTSLLDDFKVDFKLIKVNKDYYTELDTKLRELWPSGNKEGKFPWRDSVENLRIRLKDFGNLVVLNSILLKTC